MELEQLNRITTETGRVYETPTGESYPSVTTVLSHLNAKSIAQWRRRVGNDEANKVSAQASRRGTKVHKMCEDYLNNEWHEDKIVPFDTYLFKQIKDILDQHVDNIYGLEVPLFSHYLRCAGTVDCVAEFMGTKSIIDFKTSRKQKQESWITNYFMQESAYAVMFEERTKIPIVQLVTIIATEEQEPQIFIQHRDDWIDRFMVVRNQYDAMKMQAVNER